MSDVLVQTRVPQRIWQWVDQRAKLSGLSIAAWLRNHLIQEANKMRIEAWLVEKKDKRTTPPYQHPDYYLEASRDLSASERAFWLLGGPYSDAPGLPVSPTKWSSGIGPRAGELEMILKGGIVPWKIIGSMFDETSQCVEVTLKADS